MVTSLLLVYYGEEGGILYIYGVDIVLFNKDRYSTFGQDFDFQYIRK